MYSWYSWYCSLKDKDNQPVTITVINNNWLINNNNYYYLLVNTKANTYPYFLFAFSKKILGEWSFFLVFVILETHVLWMQCCNPWGMPWDNRDLTNAKATATVMKMSLQNTSSHLWHKRIIIIWSHSNYIRTNCLCISMVWADLNKVFRRTSVENSSNHFL